jgi:hypothetical protein
MAKDSPNDKEEKQPAGEGAELPATDEDLHDEALWKAYLDRAKKKRGSVDSTPNDTEKPGDNPKSGGRTP